MSSCRHPTLEDLPEKVMFEILSSLPVKTIIHCKCVCKTWRNLVMDPYFVNLHLSRSHEGLMIHRPSHNKPGFLNFVEMEDAINHQRLLHDPVLNLDLDAAAIFQYNTVAHMVGSVDGLICLQEYGGDDTTYICNPAIGHYIILPKPHFTLENYLQVHCGFGLSVAGEYKVTRIFQRYGIPNPVKIEVYTIGTDHQWRYIGVGPDYVTSADWATHGLYLNGYVHWLDGDIIYAFDLDKETFELFESTPRHKRETYSILGILKGCISVFSCSLFGFTIWVMQEHGNKQSWHKKLEIEDNGIICPDSLLWHHPLCLIDGSNDTSILILLDYEKRKLLGCCLETGRVEVTEIHGKIFEVMNYRPSFLKL